MRTNGHRFDRCLLAPEGIYPRGSEEGPSRLHGECLVEGPVPRIEVAVQFLQVVKCEVLDALGNPVEELVVTGRRHSAGIETAEREVRLASLPDRTATIRTAGAERIELTEDGSVAGTLVWRWEPLHATVEAWSDEVGPGLHRVRVEVANRLEWDLAEREQNLMRTLRSTRISMHSPAGAFVDPPAGDRGATYPSRPEASRL